MQLIGNLDDSSDQRQEKVVVYGGFVGDRKRWSNLSRRWNAVLRRHALKYFRRTECGALTGEFKRFRSSVYYPKPQGRKVADAIRGELESVTIPSGVVGVAVGVLVKDYEDVARLPEAKGILNRLPDEAAFQSIIFECAKRVREELSAGSKIRFVYDHSDKAAKLGAIYRKFIQKNPQTAKVLGRISSKDDKKTPELQAADLMAGLAKDLLVRHLETKQAPSQNGLPENIRMVGYWDKRYVLSALKDLTMVEEKRRYPIGQFIWPEKVSEQDRRLFVQQIAEAPAQLRAAVAGLNEGQLNTPYREGGWTVRQVVHHLADSHMNAFVRFKLALTETQPPVKPYNQELWAELPDAKVAPVETSLTLLECLHERFAGLLASMNAADFARTMNHPEQGIVTLERYLALYAWHGRHHAAHITSLRERMGWK